MSVFKCLLQFIQLIASEYCSAVSSFLLLLFATETINAVDGELFVVHGTVTWNVGIWTKCKLKWKPKILLAAEYFLWARSRLHEFKFGRKCSVAICSFLLCLVVQSKYNLAAFRRPKAAESNTRRNLISFTISYSNFFLVVHSFRPPRSQGAKQPYSILIFSRFLFVVLSTFVFAVGAQNNKIASHKTTTLICYLPTLLLFFRRVHPIFPFCCFGFYYGFHSNDSKSRFYLSPPPSSHKTASARCFRTI